MAQSFLSLKLKRLSHLNPLTNKAHKMDLFNGFLYYYLFIVIYTVFTLGAGLEQAEHRVLQETRK